MNLNTLTFANTDIKTIITKNCLSCHKKGGNAPFDLDNYESVYQKRHMIKYVLEKNTMPPWLPDSSYSHFRGERILSLEDKNTLLDFINGRCKKKLYNRNLIENNILNAKEEQAETEDTLICFTKKYIIINENNERNINYLFPYQNSELKYVNSIQFKYIDKSIIHHSLLSIEQNHDLRNNKYWDINKLKLSNDMTRIYFGGYLPGMETIKYPENMAQILLPNSVFVINNHYPVLKQAAYDSTCLLVKFLKREPEKIIRTLIIDIGSNGSSVVIPKDSMRFIHYHRIMKNEMTAVSILPHMHNIGKVFKAWCILPNQQQINLIKIDNWNFFRQEEYFFPEPIYLPEGTIFHIEAVFDNTASNVKNLFQPPKDILFGGNSIDEMLQLIVKYY